MAKKIILCAFICVLSLFRSVFAQDAEFTQFYASPLYLNPAFAGSTKCPRFVMNYRDQWPALKGTFVTTSASYDQYVDGLQGGLGLLILNDKAGTGAINSTSVSGIYSYQLPISKTIAAKIGLEGTYIQKNFDRNKLTFEDQIEDRAGFVNVTKETIPSETKQFADFSTGVLIYSSSVFGGLAVSHLTQPVESFNFASTGQSRLPIKYTAHIGAVIPLGKDKKHASSYLAPNILYIQQKEFNQLNLGMYIGRGALVGGLWYRTSVAKGESFLGSDSFIILLGVQQGIFKLGYSYDVTVSRLANSSAGSHEISLGLQFECRPKKKKFKAIKCPSF